MSNSGMGRCSDGALKLIADYWVLRIVEELDREPEPLRFCELQRLLEGVSPVTLTARLRSLDERGLVSRDEGTKGKASVAYQLTERGRSAVPIVRAFSEFSALN